MAGFRAWYGEFKTTLVGKVTTSFVRAFVGTFIAAEAQLFNALINLVNSHDHVQFSVLVNLAGALAIAAVTAGIRAVEAYWFEPKS